MEMHVSGSEPPQSIKNRPLDLLPADTAAVRAIAQAAVEVELFTIPLYMSTMYSIQGTHQINSKWLSYYKGRQWPGMSTGAAPGTPNQTAFDIIFSVFIQEMLHLQIAANLATAIGAKPCFTGPALQSAQHGWTCYGKDCTLIPHIVDLKDTVNYAHVRVTLDALNANQCALFLAIEQPEQQARGELAAVQAAASDKYLCTLLLEDWTPDKTALDLPLFGTIGRMYECYAQYISIEYADGQTLWQKLYDADSAQRDMFNTRGKGHASAEFPDFSVSFGPGGRDGGRDASFNKAIDMMAAITDQGEGNEAAIKRFRRGGLLKAVLPDYRENKDALEADYPSYTNDGGRAPSADAAARFGYAAYDHYERFMELQGMLDKVPPEVLTWADWHAVPSNRWSCEMLTNPLYDRAAAPDNIPGPDDVAGALNRLKEGGAGTLQLLSQVASGALYGLTSVLDAYWEKPADPNAPPMQFPYPSMVGTGDRVSLCWAVLGRSPDLSQGVPELVDGTLYHACQGLSLDGDPHGSAASGCAAMAIYHTCRGSNGCHAQGGCGFAQADAGGSSCGHSVKAAPVAGTAMNLCGGPKPATATALFSAPSDNKCKTFGGCAVPMSASQLFPATGTMKLYNFGAGPEHGASALTDTLDFALGDSVYDTAWAAFGKVMEARGKEAGAKPAPTDLRLALPPST
jgi:hypothetical protein